MTQWNGENDFDLFRSSLPVQGSQIWTAFYRRHKQKIQVQKESVAIVKLRIIVQATFKLSNQKGFSLMSLRDLSRETEISMGSLYAYIGSKGQLAEMIHQFLPYMFENCISQQIKDDDTIERQLEKIVRGHLFLTECLQPWFFFAFMETKHLSRSTKELAKESEHKSEMLLENVIAKGVKKDLYHSEDIFLSCMLIKNLLQSWYVKHSKYQSNDVSCERYIHFVDSTIANHLRGEACE